MSGHTPGPWTVRAGETNCGHDEGSYGCVSGSDDFIICDVFAEADTPLEHVAEANARLIAAAPDLLAALKRFLEYGDIYQCRTHERSPYEQAQEAVARAESLLPSGDTKE